MPERARTKIIVVDRELELLYQTRKVFQRDLVDVTLERSLEHALEKFEEQTFDILILSGAAFKFQADSAFELLELITTKCSITQILILVYPRELRLAFSALKAGTYQYAKLPISDEELRLLVETALEHRPQAGLNLFLKDDSEKPGFEDMVGRSESMIEIYRQIRQAAQTDIPVLITGETGTGKDLVARAIHQLSSRQEKPLIPIHLGALPQELVSSELFGHQKGAFTGAWKSYRGSFERAKGGTVFLDEIGAIDEKNQISLLRLLETKKFQRIGGGRSIKSNVRIITATNENLSEAVRLNRFREDLYYRLDVFPIVLPPLRKRSGDVALLVDHFLKRFNHTYQTSIRGVSPECINRLVAYGWPGNAREIKNVIHRAVVMCPGEVLLPEHLPNRLYTGQPGPPSISIRIGSTLKEVEKEVIANTLKWTNHNRLRAAVTLGISRR
ncbi:MAG: sigma-54 dependent transcriptional regulator, partial [Deltaproteobacteria bacterium]|nr:sigma-54 dependent transcriptional regulator [Deltaproteobacteria bacterium]